MKLEAPELDESMCSNDGVKGDVRDVLHEAVGVRPTAVGAVSGCTVH
jgi:hypothetical protein